jgi:hypothetical protein
MASTMSELGQSLHFGDVRVVSAFHATADLRARRAQRADRTTTVSTRAVDCWLMRVAIVEPSGGCLTQS